MLYGVNILYDSKDFVQWQQFYIIDNMDFPFCTLVNIELKRSSFTLFNLCYNMLDLFNKFTSMTIRAPKIARSSFVSWPRTRVTKSFNYKDKKNIYLQKL